jgi:hypothetical protein
MEFGYVKVSGRRSTSPVLVREGDYTSKWNLLGENANAPRKEKSAVRSAMRSALEAAGV